MAFLMVITMSSAPDAMSLKSTLSIHARVQAALRVLRLRHVSERDIARDHALPAETARRIVREADAMRGQR